METTYATYKSHTQTSEKTASQTKETAAFWEMVEFNRFGITMMLFMIALIPAGFSAAFALNIGSWAFLAVLASGMFLLTMVLGLVSMRVIFGAFIASLLISAIIITTGLIQTGGFFMNA